MYERMHYVQSRSNFLNLKKSRVGTSKATSAAKLKDGELPMELDFFKYAQGGSSKRKGGTGDEPEGKKRKLGDDGSEHGETLEGDSDEEEEEENADTKTPSAPKHRVTAKGSNVPDSVDTFLELKERYQIPALILSNLEQNGYTQPTGIQSHGIPILLEVCTS